MSEISWIGRVKMKYCLELRKKRTSCTDQDRPCRYKRNNEARSRSCCCRGKAHFSVCVCVCACVCLRAFSACVRSVVWACACACALVALSSMQRACAIVYCNLWSFWLQHVFRHYPINGTIFGKRFLNINVCLLLSTIFV